MVFGVLLVSLPSPSQIVVLVHPTRLSRLAFRSSVLLGGFTSLDPSRCVTAFILYIWALSATLPAALLQHYIAFSLPLIQLGALRVRIHLDLTVWWAAIIYYCVRQC